MIVMVFIMIANCIVQCDMGCMCKTTKWRLKPFWGRVWGVVVGVAWHLVHVICLLTPYISWIIPTEPCTLYNHCIPEYTFNHYMSNKSFNALGKIILQFCSWCCFTHHFIIVVLLKRDFNKVCKDVAKMLQMVES